MKTIPNIGNIPAIGLGTWKLTGKQCTEAVKRALEIGYRHIDTAHVYYNHAAIGEAIQHFPREQLFLVSKITEEDLDPKRVAFACERGLKELKTPYLDLLLIHWPSETIPAEKTLQAMLKLKERGLVRQIGVSNFMLSDLNQIEGYKLPILCNQIELHPYLQESKLVEYCQARQIIIVAYRPIQRATVTDDRLLNQLGIKHAKTAIQVTLRWLYQRNIVSIPKATSLKHLQENIDIFDFELSDEEMQAIAKLNQDTRFVVG